MYTKTEDNRDYRTFTLVILILIGLLSISCENSLSVGLGESPDLEGPVLSIESHTNLQFVGQTLVLSGFWSDNTAVSRIDVVNQNDQTSYSGMVITPGKWSIELELEDGRQPLLLTAYDSAGNSSIESKKLITLFVDATNPAMKQLWIETRPGTILGLNGSIEELRQLDYHSSNHRDQLINGDFKICGESEDNFIVKTIQVDIINENNETILSYELSEDVLNKASPIFDVRSQELIEADPGLASGDHYLRLETLCEDMGGNQQRDVFGWFRWDMQGDIPRVLQTQLDSFGNITVPKNSSIPFRFFDDDGIKDIYLAVLDQGQWNSILGDSNQEKILELQENSSLRNSLLMRTDLSDSEPFDKTISIASGNTAGSFYLVALVQDADSKSDGNSNKWNGLVAGLNIIDEDAPLLVIESPEENGFPSLTTGQSFSIDGYCLDNMGIASLSMAWVPQGMTGSEDEKMEAAKSALDSGSLGTLSSGLILRNISLGSPTSYSLNGRTYQRRAFSADFDIVSDFQFNGSTENQVKNFLFRTLDSDGNAVYRSFKLGFDSSSPQLSIANPSQNLLIHDPDNDLSLSFSASKLNGMAIVGTSIYEGAVSLGHSTSDSCSTTLIAADLSEGRRTYTFVAEDILGNTAQESRTVIFSEIPVLQSIDSSNQDGTYSIGDEILIQAKFSRSVKVSLAPSPRLDLRFSGSDTIPRFASYSSGSGTDTLIFSYIVSEGDNSAELHSNSSPIDLNGASITPTQGNGNAVLDSVSQSLEMNRDLALDGTRPEISGTNGSTSTGEFTEGETIVFAIDFSEALQVSDNPELRLRDNTNNLVIAAFVQSSGNTLYFEYQVRNGDNWNSLSYDYSDCFTTPHSAMIMDMSGNTLVLPGSSAVQNLSITADTLDPPVPNITPAAGVYNQVQNIEISNIEAGASAYYSKNGGLLWHIYDPNNLESIGTDNYQICAYQIDSAGNTSQISNVQNVQINVTFPEITEVSCLQPNGYYGEGSVLRFKVSFDKPIIAASGNNAALTIEFTGSGGVQRSVAAVSNANPSTVLYFDYTVQAGDPRGTITVENADLTGIIDSYNNNGGSSETLPLGGFNRPSLVLDGTAPVLGTTTPAHSATGEPLGGTVFSGTQIVLPFDENVFSESGYLRIAPHGNWLIPPVMSREEFLAVYNHANLTSADREILMQTQNGSPLLDSNGQAVGPYRKLTHGLLSNGDPDMEVKFLLVFDYDLDNAALRNVFEKAEYQQQRIDIRSSYVSISGSQVTITLPEALPVGRPWEITLDAGALRDDAGNQSAAIASGQWVSWTEQVAAPVIRLDYYSHGQNSVQPRVAGGTITGSESIADLDDTVTAPTGYLRFRIDCETPGASIDYTTDSNVLAGSGSYSSSVVDSYGTAITVYEEILVPPLVTGLSTMTPITPYSYSHSSYTDFPYVGDGTLDNSMRICIAASAELTGLSVSEKGFEGAFKTVVYYDSPRRGSATEYLQAQGAVIPGAPPLVPGFPLRDAPALPSEQCYSRVFHHDGSGGWYWISWEFRSDWQITTYTDEDPAPATIGAEHWQRSNGGYHNVPFGGYCGVQDAWFW